VEQACAALSKVRLDTHSDWFDLRCHHAGVTSRRRLLGRHSLGGADLSGSRWYIRFVHLKIPFDGGAELVLRVPEFSHCPGQGAGYFGSNRTPRHSPITGWYASVKRTSVRQVDV